MCVWFIIIIELKIQLLLRVSSVWQWQTRIHYIIPSNMHHVFIITIIEIICISLWCDVMRLTKRHFTSMNVSRNVQCTFKFLMMILSRSVQASTRHTAASPKPLCSTRAPLYCFGQIFLDPHGESTALQVNVDQFDARNKTKEKNGNEQGAAYLE